LTNLTRLKKILANEFSATILGFIRKNQMQSLKKKWRRKKQQRRSRI
jgi:hypothetical protein